MITLEVLSGIKKRFAASTYTPGDVALLIEEVERLSAKPLQCDQPLKSVALSIYGWHQLFNQLEHCMCIINRDRTPAAQLYEIIAFQLDGKRVRTGLLDDNMQPIAPKETAPPVVKKGFWARLFEDKME